MPPQSVTQPDQPRELPFASGAAYPTLQAPPGGSGGLYGSDQGPTLRLDRRCHAGDFYAGFVH